jgi:lipopolysaccharide transport system permease protein
MTSQIFVNDATSREPLVPWRELFAYRSFLRLLVWRELHLRYRHTLIGVGWSFLNPLMTMGVFGLVVPSLVSRQTLAAYTHGIPYPLYVLCGLVPWTGFTHALTRANTSLLDQGALLKNMCFPRLVLPLSKALAACVELFITLLALLLLMALLRVPPSWTTVFLPFCIAPLLMVAVGAGLSLSVLQVRYRDVVFLMQFFIQLGLLITPVWFPLDALPAPLRWAVAVNPMTAVVLGFRWAVLGAAAPSFAIVAASSISALGILMGGLHFFRKRQDTVADYV